MNPEVRTAIANGLWEQRAEVIARACHSAWYAYAVIGLGEEGEPWDSAPEWQKESIRDAIRFWDKECGEFLASTEPPEGYTLSQWARVNLPMLSHENWMNHKKLTGWTYGEKKDVNDQTHPCMLPYEELPEAQRKKDRVVVETYLAMIGAF